MYNFKSLTTAASLSPWCMMVPRVQHFSAFHFEVGMGESVCIRKASNYLLSFANRRCMCLYTFDDLRWDMTIPTLMLKHLILYFIHPIFYVIYYANENGFQVSVCN